MKLDHIVIYVDDFEHALAFYRDVVGLREVFRDGDIARLEGGSAGILLHGDDGRPKPPLPTFRSEAVDKDVGELRAAGLDVPDPVDEGWGRVTRFKDPAGNRLCVFERP